MREAAHAASIEDGLTKSNDYTDHISTKQTIRRGKWSPEEEAYANRLIEEFKSGLLPIADGVTLRTFLSKVLHCDPMRISKKFVGNNCIGKQVYRQRHCDMNQISEEVLERNRLELRELERMYLERSKQVPRSKASKSTKDNSKTVASKNELSDRPAQNNQLHARDPLSYCFGMQEIPSKQGYGKMPPPYCPSPQWLPPDTLQDNASHWNGSYAHMPPRPHFGHPYGGGVRAQYGQPPSGPPSHFGNDYMIHLPQPHDLPWINRLHDNQHHQMAASENSVRGVRGAEPFASFPKPLHQQTSRMNRQFYPQEQQCQSNVPPMYNSISGVGDISKEKRDEGSRSGSVPHVFPSYKSQQSFGQLTASDIDLFDMTPDMLRSSSSSSLDILGTVAELTLPSGRSIESLRACGQDTALSPMSFREWCRNMEKEQFSQPSGGSSFVSENNSTPNIQSSGSTSVFSIPSSVNSGPDITQLRKVASAAKMKKENAQVYQSTMSEKGRVKEEKVPPAGLHSSPTVAESRASSINSFMRLMDMGSVPRPDPKSLISSTGIYSASNPPSQEVSCPETSNSLSSNNETFETKFREHNSVEISQYIGKKSPATPAEAESSVSPSPPRRKVDERMARKEAPMMMNLLNSHCLNSPSACGTKKRKLDVLENVEDAAVAAPRPFTCM
eukprot:CAMPEP_0185038102 /NCGR_PEP_ID=MMETSP1103-20130426/33334_1 /TAXON_ID=36769 /ORGANISM="Paraphysomonas bandaiensis, Strain Caron Lab Isolate" /LENGTH=670 /DNA_ID=CAMNT_0027576379 /DNA_START=87 /DNA_END=2099 /DNA_ORIENTATION=-